jgi:hypothetical protein
MSIDWQGILKTAAPWVAAAASGPAGLIGMAASQISSSFGKDVKPTIDSISAAIAGATPDQMIALKNADNDFALKMQQMGFQDIETLETIAAGDRDSARKREIATGDWTPRILAYAIIILAGCGEGSLLLGYEPHIAPELIGRILGTLDAAVMLVLSYYFGTTNSSQRKTEIIAQQNS